MIVVAAALFIRFGVGGNEDTYVCENGEWVKHGNPLEQPPSWPCEQALPTQGMTKAKVYFSKGAEMDCNLVYGVERANVNPSDYASVLRELFRGPTTNELSEGYSSFFSNQTVDSVIDVDIVGSRAYVNLKDIRALIPNASSSCGSQSLLSQMDTTLKQDGTITESVYAIDGKPRDFYEWLQYDCPDISNDCDPTPFEE